MKALNNKLQKTHEVLCQSGLILYPTDTVWGIGCDAENPEAVEKVFRLKMRDDAKALICLVSDEKMLKRYVAKLPNLARELIITSKKPTTIIYDGAKNLAKNLIAEDGSIAIRIPKDDFCQQLLKKFDRAIVSTSANISGEPTPSSFQEISNDILKGVDYIVNLHREKICDKPSRILKVDNDGNVTIIRD